MTKMTTTPTAPPSLGSQGDSGGSLPPILLPWGSIWAAMLALALCGVAITRLILPADRAGLFFLPVLALLICMLAAGFDTAMARIPNPLTYTAILLGLGINTIAGLLSRMGLLEPAHFLGAVGVGQAFLGFALTAGVGIVCLTLAGMGGGDLKLMVALGAILGSSQVTMVLLWTMAIAVPYALINLFVLGRLNGVLRAVGLQVLQILLLRRFESVDAPSKTSIPLAVPMLIALICTRAVSTHAVMRWLGMA